VRIIVAGERSSSLFDRVEVEFGGPELLLLNLGEGAGASGEVLGWVETLSVE